MIWVFFLIVTTIIARTASGTVSVILGKSQSGITMMGCRDKKSLACVTRPMPSPGSQIILLFLWPGRAHCSADLNEAGSTEGSSALLVRQWKQRNVIYSGPQFTGKAQ